MSKESRGKGEGRKSALALAKAALYFSTGNYAAAAVNTLKAWKIIVGVVVAALLPFILLVSLIISLPGIIMQSILPHNTDKDTKLATVAEEQISATQKEKNDFVQSVIDSVNSAASSNDDEEGKKTVAEVDLNIDYQDILILYSVKYGEYFSKGDLDQTKVRTLAEAFVKHFGPFKIGTKSFDEVVNEIDLDESQKVVALNMYQYKNIFVGSNTGGPPLTGGAIEGSTGVVIWPISSRHITSPFGTRIHPITHKKSFHTGIDIATPTGTPVHAADGGTVIAAKYDKSYGNYVMLDHGLISDGRVHLVTLYAHNSKLNVTVGQTVKQGDVISYSGSTGNSTGPHLHFEVRVNGAYDNPMKWLL